MHRTLYKVSILFARCILLANRLTRRKCSTIEEYLGQFKLTFDDSEFLIQDIHCASACISRAERLNTYYKYQYMEGVVASIPRSISKGHSFKT
jgi:hypothetical protein